MAVPTAIRRAIGLARLGANRLYPLWLGPQGAAMEGFKACFEGLQDPRTGNAGRHDLLEMLMIALCTVLCGGEDCTDMAEFAATKLEFLRGFLKLEHGAPSHDTFSRLFRLLDPEQFRACFQCFMARLPRRARGSWRSMARCCAARSTKPAASRRCIWSRPGAASSGWCSA